jgi:predicted Zn finger-like uncharacterized protein
MYTSCPECGTVYRISTNELRAAEGLVRCGHCLATFSAIETLADEPPPAVTLRQLDLPPEPVPAESTAAPEPLPGFPSEPARPGSPPELRAAATWVPLPVDEDTLEFDIPEERWSKFFDRNAPGQAPPDEAVTLGIDGDGQDPGGEVRTEAGGLNLDDDADWQALLAEVRNDDSVLDPVYVISEASPEAAPGNQEPPEPAWDDAILGRAVAPAPLPPDFAADLPGVSVAGPAPQPVGDGRPFVWESPSPPAKDSSHHRGYAAGSVLAALLLVIQVIHQQRDELATNPSLTAPLERTYRALGLPLWPAWDLRAYELRNSEAVADRTSPGALDILARIAVVGNEHVGLPLVRVTLRDRFSRPLGSRVFEPAEYLGRNSQPREPVRPGTLIPVEISLRDLGADAQGFDVDVCLMTQREGITCRSEYGPFAR